MAETAANENGDRDWRESQPPRDLSGDQRCQFRLFRVDPVSLTSAEFDGGDWRWQFCSASGEILSQCTGYRSEAECRAAVLRLQNEAPYASITTVG